MWTRTRSIIRRHCPKDLLPETHDGFAVSASQTIPTARGLPIVGTTLSIIAAGSAPHLHEYVSSRHRQLGPVFREKLGPTDAVLVADPNEMRRVFALEGKYPRHFLPEPWLEYNRLHGCKRGLLFMDGDEWLYHRRILNRLLMRADSWRPLVAPCNQVANDLVERWKRNAGAEVLNLEEDLYQWSIEVILAVLMGDEKYRSNKHLLKDTVTELASTVFQVFETSAQLSLTHTKLAIFLGIPAWKRFMKAVGSTMNTAKQLVTRIVPESHGREGLLGCMMSDGIAMDDVHRIIADMILAAGDTVAHTMEWALYALARQPLIQDQLYEELSVLQDPDDVIKSELLKNTIREVLRLYPVAPFLTRFMPENTVIGGYPVTAGQLVILSQYSSSRDEKNYPRASEFWPGRWSRGNDGSGAGGNRYGGVACPYASLPFAMGARSCVGRKLAETQMAAGLANILGTFKLELVDPSPVNVVLRLVAVPSKPVRIWITER